MKLSSRCAALVADVRALPGFEVTGVHRAVPVAGVEPFTELLNILHPVLPGLVVLVRPHHVEHQVVGTLRI